MPGPQRRAEAFHFFEEIAEEFQGGGAHFILPCQMVDAAESAEGGIVKKDFLLSGRGGTRRE